MLILGCGWQQIQATEAARVDQADPPAVVGEQRQMLVPMPRRFCPVERGCVRVFLHEQAPGHAEMHQHAFAAGKAHQDIFGTPTKPQDFGAGKPRGKPLRQRPAQIGPCEIRADDPPPGDACGQPAHYCFHFWEFRHR